MVCPIVICTGHCSGVEDIMPIFGADDDIVDEVPDFRARMHPLGFEFVLLVDQCAGNDQVVF